MEMILIILSKQNGVDNFTYLFYNIKLVRKARMERIIWLNQ